MPESDNSKEEAYIRRIPLEKETAKKRLLEHSNFLSTPKSTMKVCITLMMAMTKKNLRLKGNSRKTITVSFQACS